MVITDPTIDPITGLPVLNPADVIQQIPLGVQIFPYEDLLATSRPTRGPLAGEDILPVSSMTAGQHPSTGSAQTVGTDGNHRLLVSVEGGGSGGGGSPVALQHWSDSVTTDAGHITQSGFVPAPTTIWGVGWYMSPISVMPVNTNYVGECWVAFGSDGSTGLIAPFLILPPKLTYTGAALDGSGKPYVEAEVWFPSGWDCRGYLSNGKLYCYVRAQNYDLETDVHVYYT